MTTPKPLLNTDIAKPGPKNCPKCRGYIQLQQDHYGAYLCCLNCGKHFSFTRSVRELRPETVTRESAPEEIRRQDTRRDTRVLATAAAD